MDAAGHLAKAERLLDRAARGTDEQPYVDDGWLIWLGVGHAVAAIAIELGVPHPAAPQAGGTDVPGV